MASQRVSAPLALALLAACLFDAAVAFQLAPSSIARFEVSQAATCRAEPRVPNHARFSTVMSGNEERQERNLPQVLANNAMTLAMASMIALMPSGAIADDVVLANNVNLGFMSMAAVELPEGWESSITPGTPFLFDVAI